MPQNLVDEYRWVFGLSVTEMEIIHGAYRKDNPNCTYIIITISIYKWGKHNYRYINMVIIIIVIVTFLYFM